MRRPYSRLIGVEEKRNTRKAILFIILTVAFLPFVLFIGIPALGKFTVFISDLRGGSKAIVKNDTTPPAPPIFNYIPSFTNQQTASVSGTTEPGATIKLTSNGGSQETLADKDGAFSFILQLQSGVNSYSGNQSLQAKSFQITFDNQPPSLSVTTPSDGSSFFGSAQRQITIQGKTDAGAQIVINDRIISVDDSGNFQYTTTLNDGANPFAIKATDQAGNITEKDITLNFTP
jgi:hypothetical protein